MILFAAFITTEKGESVYFCPTKWQAESVIERWPNATESGIEKVESMETTRAHICAMFNDLLDFGGFNTAGEPPPIIDRKPCVLISTIK